MGSKKRNLSWDYKCRMVRGRGRGDVVVGLVDLGGEGVIRWEV